MVPLDEYDRPPGNDFEEPVLLDESAEVDSGGAPQRTQSRPQAAAFDTDLDDDVPF